MEYLSEVHCFIAKLLSVSFILFSFFACILKIYMGDDDKFIGNLTVKFLCIWGSVIIFAFPILTLIYFILLFFRG